MNSCAWEEIDAFRGSGEFRQFQQWLAEQVKSGVAEQIPVAQRYAVRLLSTSAGLDIGTLLVQCGALSILIRRLPESSSP